jgi:hypothetical protein
MTQYSTADRKRKRPKHSHGTYLHSYIWYTTTKYGWKKKKIALYMLYKALANYVVCYTQHYKSPKPRSTSCPYAAFIILTYEIIFIVEFLFLIELGLASVLPNSSNTTTHTPTF